MRQDRIAATGAGFPEGAEVAVVGAGATGSHMIALLARHGVDLRVVDRDVLEPENLATSALYTPEMVEERLPKAVAADRAVAAEMEAHVAHLDAKNVAVLDGADLVLDGTDNMEARRLLNEYALARGVPFVHAAALGARGQVLPVDGPPCMDCVLGHVDGAMLGTCETEGILPEAAATAAAVAVRAAARLLQGGETGGLHRFDLERGEMRELDVAERGDCPACAGERPHLEGAAGTRAAVLCGREKVHVDPDLENRVKLSKVAEKLEELGKVDVNDHLLRFEGGERFTLFRDGRAIVDAGREAEALRIYDRFVGR